MLTTKSPSENLYERTLITINNNLYENYVMLRSYSEDFFDLPETKILGERNPKDIFTISYLKKLQLPCRQGLIVSSPFELPTYGWYYPEWADILFSIAVLEYQKIGRKQLDISLDKYISSFMNEKLLQELLVKLNRKEGLKSCMKVLEMIS